MFSYLLESGLPVSSSKGELVHPCFQSCPGCDRTEKGTDSIENSIAGNLFH